MDHQRHFERLVTGISLEALVSGLNVPNTIGRHCVFFFGCFFAKKTLEGHFILREKGKSIFGVLDVIESSMSNLSQLLASLSLYLWTFKQRFEENLTAINGNMYLIHFIWRFKITSNFVQTPSSLEKNPWQYSDKSRTFRKTKVR